MYQEKDAHDVIESVKKKVSAAMAELSGAAPHRIFRVHIPPGMTVRRHGTTATALWEWTASCDLCSQWSRSSDKGDGEEFRRLMWDHHTECAATRVQDKEKWLVPAGFSVKTMGVGDGHCEIVCDRCSHFKQIVCPGKEPDYNLYSSMRAHAAVHDHERRYKPGKFSWLIP